MSILRFECIGGASGDMVLAALVDLGVPAEAISEAVSSIGAGALTVRATRVTRNGLAGTEVTVETPHEHHVHRGLQDILTLIRSSPLPDPVKRSSSRVFTRLAEAEARVHGTTTDKIHFHEVGALDSIADIVGACFALHELKADVVRVGAFPIGHGTIECEHGVLPSPAPATMALLEGHDVVETDEPFELVTPTGAALLTTWRTREPGPGPVKIVRTGCGFGQRTLKGRPNLLRVALAEPSDAGSVAEDCIVLESNIDDTTPELLGTLTQRLMEAGALDAFTTAVQMKKQRPGALLTVLCTLDRKAAVLDLIFHESTTFGVREYATRRTMLERRAVELETPHGKVRVKIGSWKGQDVTWSPEMEDCVTRAKEHALPVRRVYEAALDAARAWRERSGGTM